MIGRKVIFTPTNEQGEIVACDLFKGVLIRFYYTGWENWCNIDLVREL